jgi:hypothetical protein
VAPRLEAAVDAGAPRRRARASFAGSRPCHDQPFGARAGDQRAWPQMGSARRQDPSVPIQVTTPCQGLAARERY